MVPSNDNHNVRIQVCHGQQLQHSRWQIFHLLMPKPVLTTITNNWVKLSWQTDTSLPTHITPTTVNINMPPHSHQLCIIHNDNNIPSALASYRSGSWCCWTSTDSKGILYSPQINSNQPSPNVPILETWPNTDDNDNIIGDAGDNHDGHSCSTVKAVVVTAILVTAGVTVIATVVTEVFSIVIVVTTVIVSTLCLKNDTDVTHYNFNAYQPILVLRQYAIK